MREVIDFLRELRQNNDREWFNANKAAYKHVESIFSDFAVGLIDGIASFDDSVRGLGLKDCTYRIYRDTRFSNDKSPYKTYMGIYVAPHGKKQGMLGTISTSNPMSKISSMPDCTCPPRQFCAASARR